MEYETVHKLIRGLRKWGLKRVRLSAVVCKVLFNLAYACGGAGEAYARCFYASGSELVETVGLLRDTLLELLDVAEDAREEEMEECKGEDGGGGGGGGGGGRYDEFIQTGGALLKVVQETWEFLGGVDGGEEDENEGYYDDEEEAKEERKIER